MLKRLLLLGLLLSTPALGAQPLLSLSTVNLSTTTKQYGTLGAAALVATTTAVLNYPPSPAAGTVGTLTVHLTVAPGTGNTRVFTIQDNVTDTALTCTISNTATDCTDVVDTPAVAVGDTLNWSAALTGTPVASVVKISAVFTPTTTDENILLTRTASPNATSLYYSPVSNGTNTAWTSTEPPVIKVFPDTGTLSKFYFSTNTGGGTAKGYNFLVDQNSTPTLMGCNVLGSGTGAGVTTCNDGTHTLSVSPGDFLDISELPINTPTVITTGFGIKYVPSTSGNFVFLSSTIGTADNAGSPAFGVISGDRGYTTESASTEVMPIAFRLTGIRVVTTDPGGVAIRTFGIRVNGSTIAGLSCTVNGGSTSCNATGSISLNAGDLVCIIDTPSGSPATGIPVIGLVGTTTASATTVTQMGFLGVGP